MRRRATTKVDGVQRMTVFSVLRSSVGDVKSGFVAVKIHPPNGFRPWGNTGFPNRAVSKAAEIDAALEKFWIRCQEVIDHQVHILRLLQRVFNEPLHCGLVQRLGTSVLLIRFCLHVRLADRIHK